jgi:hypothetical protein
LPVALTSVPLPTGAATESTLSSLNNKFNTEIALDFDTGGGTQMMKLFGLALPASGGAVAGGTSTNPLNVVFPSAQSINISGTPTFNPGNTANTTPWLMTINQGGNSAAVTAGGRLQVTCDNCGGSGGTAQSDNSAVASITGAGALFDATPPSITEGNVGLFRMNSARVLMNDFSHYNGSAVGASNAVHVQPGTSATFTVTATNLSTNIAQFGGQSVVNGGLNGVLGIGGPTAVDAALNYNPLVIGGRAGNSPQTAVSADGDIIAMRLDRSGHAMNRLVDGSGDSVSEDAQNAIRTWLINRLEDTQDSVALRDGSGNLIATATTTPGGSDRGLVVRVAGTLPAGTEFNIGDVHSATGAGRAALGIRRDTAAVPSGVADGDWTVPIFDSANRMHVAVGSFPANTGFNISQIGGNTTVTGGVSGSLGVGGVAAHDASGTSINPILTGGVASAAAPSDVSADNDLVRAWYLRNGAQAIQPTFGGTLWSTGNGAAGAGVPRVTIANDSTGVIGLAAGSNLIGMTVPSATATTTNSLLTSYLASAASTNSTNVKSSAGNVYSIVGINTTGTIYYLRMYNLSSAPTCSSATGFVNTYPVPAHTSGNGFVIPIPQGQGFSTGIGFCLTGGAGSTDNTNAATGVFLTFLYK